MPRTEKFAIIKQIVPDLGPGEVDVQNLYSAKPFLGNGDVGSTHTFGTKIEPDRAPPATRSARVRSSRQHSPTAAGVDVGRRRWTYGPVLADNPLILNGVAPARRRRTPWVTRARRTKRRRSRRVRRRAQRRPQCPPRSSLGGGIRESSVICQRLRPSQPLVALRGRRDLGPKRRGRDCDRRCGLHL